MPKAQNFGFLILFPGTSTCTTKGPRLATLVPLVKILCAASRGPQRSSLFAPSSVSFSTRYGGTFRGPHFFFFSSAKSHDYCLHFKVTLVINDKKPSKAPSCDWSSACNTMNLRSSKLCSLVMVETIKERCAASRGPMWCCESRSHVDKI